MSEPQIETFAVTEHYGSVYERGERDRRYCEGTVTTPYGIVRVYSEANMTAMWIVRHGREVSARWRRGFRPRYLVTLARRFARGEFG
jgi:hypothetical protein